MSMQNFRKVSSRKFKPSIALLEERCTPTVNSLSVFGVAPGIGGSANVTLGGIVRESSGRCDHPFVELHHRG